MIVFTYPGQGSQFPGMGNSWIKHPSWELIEEASDATHIDIEDLLINADEDSLRQTENAQLSTFVLSMLMLDAVERLGIDATGHAGHSLGEYSALTASASLDFFDATKLVQIRGNAMKKAIETGDLDASSFVARFLNPDLPDTASLLLKMPKTPHSSFNLSITKFFQFSNCCDPINSYFIIFITIYHRSVYILN